MRRSNSQWMAILSILSLGVILLVGCGRGGLSGYTALEPGSVAPDMTPEGWVGEVPQIEGKVVVLEAFATW